MNYEEVIPFSTFYKNELTPSDSNKIFNYQIKINPATESENTPNGNNGMRGGGMHRGGMGGGMRGGGMGGGMRGGNGNRMSGENRSGDYQKNTNLSGITKTTIKLRLAYR